MDLARGGSISDLTFLAAGNGSGDSFLVLVGSGETV
jgi:hypothetical protein